MKQQCRLNYETKLQGHLSTYNNTCLCQYHTDKSLARVGKGGTGCRPHLRCQYAQELTSKTPGGACSKTSLNSSHSQFEQKSLQLVQQRARARQDKRLQHHRITHEHFLP